MSFLERDRPIDHWQEEHDGDEIDKNQINPKMTANVVAVMICSLDWHMYIATLTYICPNDS
jgi:hypothetical protein